MLSGPIMDAHYIQPIAFVIACRRFGLMQFPSSQLRSLFWHFAYSTTPERFFLLVANLVFAALPHAALHGPRVAMLGMREITVTFYSPSPLFSASFIFSSCLLRACFESTVGAFLNNLLLLEIWSELSTFWHKFAVVHDKECIVPASSKS